MNLINRREIIAAGGMALIASRARAAPGVTLGEVLANHERARGGRAALSAIRAITTELLIEERGSTLKARYSASLEPRMRIDVVAGDQRVWSEGIDGAGAWEWPGGQPAPNAAHGPAALALQHGIEFNLIDLSRYPSRGHRLTLTGQESRDGRTSHIVQADLKDGFQTFFLIDAASWMIVRRRDFRAMHPDLDAKKTWLENVDEDFRVVAGVKAPFLSRQVDMASGKTLQTTTTQSLAYNPVLPESALTRPAAA